MSINTTNNSKEYKEDQIIFLEYEPGNTFYLIQSGSVRITKLVSNIEKTVDIITAGDFFGEMAILEEAPRSASAIANENSVVIEFDKDSFDVLMKDNPMLALKILRSFSIRIFDSKNRLTILRFKEPEIKVYACLLTLAEINHISKDAYHKPQILDATAAEIASWTALTTAEVNHVLTRLARTGKITIQNKSMVVKNLDEIQRLIDKKRKTLHPD